MKRAPADRCKIPQALWRAFDHLGLRPAAVLRQARLPSTLYLNPQAVVNTAQFFAVWKAVEDLTADPGIGIKLVEASNTAGHQPLFLAASFAADYRDGLTRIQRFKRLTSCEQLRSDERDGEFSMFKEWPYASETEPLTSVEMSFAFALALGRRGTGQPLTPIRLEFAHAGPHSKARQSFFGCPIRYGAPCNVLVMKSSDLDRPFPGHNMELLDILTPALTAALSEPQVHIAVADQVKTALKRRLAAGRPEVADVAHDLGMSERTLQRRITVEGASFRALLVQARQELSRELLSDPSIDLDEVACLLGYQDTSSFYRAFKDWEGVTPAQWLERNADSARARQGPVRLI